jgi:choice-of-anchor C domain-containing protein
MAPAIPLPSDLRIDTYPDSPWATALIGPDYLAADLLTAQHSVVGLDVLPNETVSPDASLAEAGNLVINGSFEDCPAYPNMYDNITLYPGSTDLIGWEVILGSINWNHALHLAPADGTYSLDLNGELSCGGIQQTIPTTPGRWYDLSFSMGANIWSGPWVRTMRVSAGDAFADFMVYAEGEFIYPYMAPKWTTHTWSFQATSTATLLQFVSTSAPTSYGPALDNVVVTQRPGPEPIDATVDIDPDTLNLHSKGKWITCYVTLPEGYEVSEVDPATILLNEQIAPAWSMVDEEENVLTIKFDRSAVQQLLQPSEMVLVVMGSLTDGTLFYGTDTIVVIDPSKP